MQVFQKMPQIDTENDKKSKIFLFSPLLNVQLFYKWLKCSTCLCPGLRLLAADSLSRSAMELEGRGGELECRVLPGKVWIDFTSAAPESDPSPWGMTSRLLMAKGLIRHHTMFNTLHLKFPATKENGTQNFIVFELAMFVLRLRNCYSKFFSSFL